MAVTRALIVQTSSGLQPALIRTDLIACNEAPRPAFTLMLGSTLYSCQSAAPLSDAFERSFREALLAPGSQRYRYKVHAQAGQGTFIWRSAEQEYQLDIQEASLDHRQHLEEQFAVAVPALTYAEQQAGMQAHTSDQCQAALQTLKGAATERAAIIDACAKLLRSRTRLIHTLQQQSATAQGPPAGAHHAIAIDLICLLSTQHRFTHAMLWAMYSYTLRAYMSTLLWCFPHVLSDRVRCLDSPSMSCMHVQCFLQVGTLTLRPPQPKAYACMCRSRRPKHNRWQRGRRA